MNEQTMETLRILQEECAEVIQAISKVFRFGLQATHPDTPNQTNLYRLQEELGDLLAMIELLVDSNVGVSDEGLVLAKNKKFEKLKKWSALEINK
jgi:NTP pyrophosphatase (non-canonical NTP hydrolase)